MPHEAVLVVHVTAAALLIGGGLLLAASGLGLTTLERGRELAPWAVLATSSAPLTVGAGLVVFATGGHLAGTRWSFAEGWVTVSAVVLTVLGVAAVVLYRRLWRLGAEVRALGDAPAPRDLRERLGAPVTWMLAHALVLAGPAFITVMVLRTGFVASTLWLGGGAGVGLVSGALFARRGARVRVAGDGPER